MILPFRAKNPPERFPYVTLSLIAINTLIFAFTSDFFIRIQEQVVDDWALSNATFSIVRMFSAMFLHSNLFHLIGNMLALWLFGASVEGRLGYLKYLALYLITGLAGDVLHSVVIGIGNPEQFSLGASGAIMGMAGAFLYLFPFARISTFITFGLGFYWRFWIVDIQARWIILFYIASDIVSGLFLGAASGVGNFAHLGGAAAGILGVMALRTRRDSEEYSEAQKLRSESGGDYMGMSMHELSAYVEADPTNHIAILAYIRKAVSAIDSTSAKMGYETLHKHARLLVEKGDEDGLCRVLLLMPEQEKPLPANLLLRFGSRLEASGEIGLAQQNYQQMRRRQPNAPETEMALLRLGRLLEEGTDEDVREAAYVYTELLQRFPNSPNADMARQALKRTGVPVEKARPKAIPEGLAIVGKGDTPESKASEPEPEKPAGDPSMLAPVGEGKVETTASAPSPPARSNLSSHDDDFTLTPIGG